MGNLNIGTAIVLLLFAVLSCVAIGVGLLMRFRPLVFSSTRWTTQLVAWNIIGANEYKPLLVQDVLQTYYRIQSFSVVGIGSATLLYLLLISFVINSLKSFTDIFLFESQVFVGGFYFCLIMGASIGFLVGAWRVRASVTKRDSTYGDLQRRQLSDYRANLFRLFPIALTVCVPLLTFLVFPILGSTIQLGVSRSGAAIYGAKSVLALSILPALILLILLIMETMMHRITNLSRFRVTYDPVAGQNADNMLRSIVIGMIQGYEFVIVGLLSVTQLNIIERGLWHIGNRPFSLVFDMFFYLALLVQASGFLILALQGRLGGKVSQWPWQHRQGF